MGKSSGKKEQFKSLAATAEMLCLLDHSERSIIVLDSQFRIMWFNALAARGMYSFYHEDLKSGYSYWDYVDEDRNKRFIRNFKAALQGRKITTEQRIERPDVNSSEIWVEGRFTPFKDEQNNIIGVVYSYLNISDRKRKEQEDISRAKVLHAIDHNDSQAFILINEDDRILSCNIIAPVLLATVQDRKDPYGKNLLRCIHPDWQERFAGGLKLARAGGTAAIEFERPADPKTVFEIRFTPVNDRLGKQRMVSIWAFDISDKKKAEKDVRDSEEHLRAVFDNSTQSFYLLDKKLNIIVFNRTSELLNLERFQVQLKQGSSMLTVIPKENLIQFKVEAARAFSGRKVVVEKFVNIQGRDHWFERHMNPVKNSSGKIDRIAVWSMDITERKKAEKDLKENESKFRKLASLLPVGIYQSDGNGNITYINESLQIIIGSQMDAILDGSWKSRIHTDDVQKAKRIWKSADHHKRGYSVEYRLLKNSDQTAHLLEQGQPLFNHVGEYRGYVGTVIDITEQKKAQQLAQQKLIAENSLRFRSEFLASMSHEIRTPLNGIMGLSEVLLDTGLNADQHSKVFNILHASEDLKSIVNDVLDLSKLEAGKVDINKESLNLTEFLQMISERYTPLAHKKQLTFRVEDLTEHLTISTDRRRLTQIVSNLVGNALKFTDKGEVLIKASCSDKNELRIEVQDTGRGIPKKDQKKLFIDFSQIQHTTAQDLEGTGLGLSISRKLVQLLGGNIGVESAPKKGSCFWFTIPVGLSSANEEQDPETAKPADKEYRNEISVMLVEDNLINQAAFKIMLQRMGCKVKVLSNGKQAVEQFEADKYDIVFMDIQMPIMDGLLATSEIKRRFKHVPPIIGLTGNILQRDKDGNLDSGMDDLLLKPVASHEMEQMLRKWVV